LIDEGLGHTLMVLHQGDPPNGGAGGILYLLDSHSLCFKAGIGQGRNNFSEMMALKLVHFSCRIWEISHLDFWGLTACHKMPQQGIHFKKFPPPAALLGIWGIQEEFTSVSYNHIYKDEEQYCRQLIKRTGF
jgi:hypothetical protein